MTDNCKLLRHAASLLDQEAAALRETNFAPFGENCVFGENGLSGKRTWADDESREWYQELRRTAKELRLAAKYSL